MTIPRREFLGRIAAASAVTIVGIALRVPYRRLLWDAKVARFTNSDDANALLRRAAWRPGWDTLVG
jgi:hypothetical protein